MKRGFQDGSQKYQQRAKTALPLLVARAKVWGTFTYGQLARLLKMPNPRNLNHVLGAIGRELRALGKEWKEEVPPIECIVINKSNKTPGRGIGFHMPVERFKELTPPARKLVLRNLHLQIWGYPKWDAVLQHFNLAPAGLDQELMDLANKARSGRAGGESADHQSLKEYIAGNPHVLGLAKALATTEYPFASRDEIDVLLKYPKEWVGIEVKGINSDKADLLRGIFQCIKYQALIEAEQRFQNQFTGGRVLLVLGGILPSSLREVADLFQLDVRERITVPAKFTRSSTAKTAGV